jgi:hypothetical protein
MPERDLVQRQEVSPMSKFRVYQACSALVAIAAVAIASGAGWKFS